MTRSIIAVGLLVLTVWAYRPILSHPFVYEDSHITTPSLNWIPRRPLAQLSGAILTTPAEAHAFSLAVHLLNGTLVALLAVRLGLSPVAALVAMGVFLLHPIQSEAVAYAVERSELMSVTGLLLAVLAATLESAVAWVGIVAGSLIAMAAKESGVVVVGLVPWVWLMEGRRWTRMMTLLTAFLGVGIGIGVPVGLMITSASGVSFAWWVSRLGLAGWRLLSLILIPVGLSIDHDYYGVPVWQGLVAGLALVGGAIHLFLSTEHWETRFAVGWIACCLLPRIFIRVPLSILPEHQVYSAMVGVSLWGGALFCRCMNGPATTSRVAI